MKKIFSFLLSLLITITSASFAIAEDADIAQMENVRDESFEAVELQTMPATGVAGFSTSLSTGITSAIVSVPGSDGNQTHAVQIKRGKNTTITACKFQLNPLPEYKTARLVYSFDIRNGGKCGTKQTDVGYTNQVNNYFASFALLGVTFDFNQKSVIFPESLTSKPVVPEKVAERVLPSNGKWFNVRIEIDALKDEISVYINNKLAGTQIYGGRFMRISSADMTISLKESGTGENAAYIDNVKIDKSAITADELERIYNNDLFQPLGDAFVMYPGSAKVYYADGVSYFNDALTISPLSKDGTTYVPIRYIAEKRGFSVGYDGNIKLTGDKDITLTPSDYYELNDATYCPLTKMADILDYKSYESASGLILLLPKDRSVPSDDTLDKLTALYPEACLGIETDGGWYTEADLLSASGATEAQLDVNYGVGGRVKHTDYQTLRNGVSRSTKNVHSGKYSLKWDRHNFYPTVMTTGAPTDWTQYNTLSFWLYSEVATNEHITVGAVSNPHDSYGEYVINEHTTNFLWAEFRVDFTGWKHFEIPLSDFTPSTDQVVGFNKVDGLYFYSRAFDYEPYPQTVLYIDDVKLEVLTAEDEAVADEAYEAPIKAHEEEVNGPHDYVLDVPELYKDITLLDWGYVLEYKKSIEQNDANAAASTKKLNDIYKKYGITSDPYKYSDLVVQNNFNNIYDEELPIDKINLNHTFPEVVEQPAEGYLNTQPYFKEARAITGYNPRYFPNFVSSWRDFRYMYIAQHILEYVDYEGIWHLYDYSAQIDRYAREELGFKTYKLRCSGFYDETKLRFDNDGAAYTTIMLQGTREDGTGGVVGVLGYSTDNLKSWKFYKLPRAFAKMEILDGHNQDCLDGPPVILLHNYWSNNNDQRGAFVIPEKQPDGTLVIPEETIYSELPIICTSQHSGKANYVQTLGDKVYIVYAVCPNEDYSQAAHDMCKNLVPQGHQIWDLLNNELKQYMVSDIGAPTFIIEYDKTTKKLSEPVFLATAGSTYNDNHNWPALSLDSEGYLNVFIIGHHFPLLYVKSKNPGDITSWNPLEVVSSGISYASMNIGSDDTIYAITRNSNDGYTFDICLEKKTKDGDWTESRIVKYWKQYYMVWGDDVYMDPVTDDLYVMFRSKTNWMELFADQWAAKDFIFPDASIRSTDVYPTGTSTMPVRQYANSGSNIRGEHTVMVSHDHGETWQMATTEDFMPKK